MLELPYRPYCALPDKRVTIRPRETAFDWPYVQHNWPGFKNIICVDIDTPTDPLCWRDMCAPAPNFVAYSPKTNRPHLLYELEAPVKLSSEAYKPRPAYTLNKVENALISTLGGDVAAKGSIVQKNPRSPYWTVYRPRERAYSLSELCDNLDMSRQSLRNINDSENFGIGRNCALFDEVRFPAYREVNEWRNNGEYDPWLEHNIARATKFNGFLFTTPLPFSEVRSVAKSVARWTWRHYWKTGCSRNIERGAMRGLISTGMSLSEKQSTVIQAINAPKIADTKRKIELYVADCIERGDAISVNMCSKVTGVSKAAVRKYLPSIA